MCPNLEEVLGDVEYDTVDDYCSSETVYVKYFDIGNLIDTTIRVMTIEGAWLVLKGIDEENLNDLNERLVHWIDDSLSHRKHPQIFPNVLMIDVSTLSLDYLEMLFIDFKSKQIIVEIWKSGSGEYTLDSKNRFQKIDKEGEDENTENRNP